MANELEKRRLLKRDVLRQLEAIDRQVDLLRAKKAAIKKAAAAAGIPRSEIDGDRKEKRMNRMYAKAAPPNRKPGSFLE